MNKHSKLQDVSLSLSMIHGLLETIAIREGMIDGGDFELSNGLYGIAHLVKLAQKEVEALSSAATSTEVVTHE